jgi:HAMP domain-containing protein
MSLLAESPLSKERILGMLPVLAGLLEKWSEYTVEERDAALEHYVASANYVVRVTVQDNSADFVIARRGERPIITLRRFGWGLEQSDNRLTALIPVTAEEMLALETRCGATRRMPVKAAFSLWLKLDTLSRTGKREDLFGSSERFGDILGPVWSAAMLKLDVMFEV